MATKWAEMVSSEQPAREFARQVLTERMAAVESLLPLSAHHYREDVEHVHQLRVGCRRASAAMRAFEPLFSAKPNALKKWLSRIRDAAGPARDIDVLLGRFTSETTESTESTEDSVTAYAFERLESERRMVQEKLVKVAAKASRGKLVESVEKCLRSLAENPGSYWEPNCREMGRMALRVACNAFVPLAHLPNPTITELHQLRITGKRLRYSIEIFHAAFPARLKQEVYPMIATLQDRLGKINDRATAQALFQSWLAPMDADALAADLARRIIEEYEEAIKLNQRFSKWWTEKRVAKLEEALHELVLDE